MRTAELDLAGVTLGVEEEYHLVEPDTFRLARRPLLSEQADARSVGPHLQAEMLTSQLEAATEVCTDLRQVRDAIAAMRLEAATAAAAHGTLLLGTSTHPQAGLDEIEIAPRDRYRRLLDRYRSVVGELNLCGCHVHVSVPNLDVALAVMNHARPYLPLLAALTASSPFHEGRDTGYASIRLARLALWPQGGPPPHLASAQDYQHLLAALTASGMIDEPSELLWELRPSARYPTVEFRIADMCPDIDDVVLYAGLVRSLVRTLMQRIISATPAPVVPDPLLSAARWRAAHYGLTERLWSDTGQALLPAADVIEQFWNELAPDLERHGESGELEALLAQVLKRGNSATRQRQVFAETGALTEVIRDAVILTMPPSRHGTRTATT
ncbi:MAG: glutamate--cysteine ligase [Actinobacteria bacterium]|nr:glutamate--cysteine ligase [Actinomycetota bacterium]